MEEKDARCSGIIFKEVSLTDLSTMIMSSVRTAITEKPTPIPMTKEEVCKIIGITKPTLQSWVKKGMLHPIEIDKKIFFDTCEVMKIVSRLR